MAGDGIDDTQPLESEHGPSIFIFPSRVGTAMEYRLHHFIYIIGIEGPLIKKIFSVYSTHTLSLITS